MTKRERRTIRAEPVQTFCHDSGVTLSLLVAAAWGLFLAKQANTEDVVFGVLSAGRAVPVSGVAQMVGMLVHQVPLRLQVCWHVPVSHGGVV